MTTRNLALTNSYRDSVELMRLSQELEQMSGVQQATIIMGSDNNKAMLEIAGLLTEDGNSHKKKGDEPAYHPQAEKL